MGTDDSGSIIDQDSTSVITINDPESPELNQTFTLDSKMDLDFSDPDNGQVRYIYDVTGEGVSLNYRLEGALSGLESGNLGLDFAGKFSTDLDGESAAGEFTFTYSDGNFALNITGDGESDVLVSFIHENGDETELVWIWDPVERYVFREDLSTVSISGGADDGALLPADEIQSGEPYFTQNGLAINAAVEMGTFLLEDGVCSYSGLGDGYNTGDC